MSTSLSQAENTDQAREQLDEHLREMLRWHFSPETGCPYWLDWAKREGWNPIDEIQTFDDMVKFPHFQDDVLRDEPPHRWVPKSYEEKPHNIFETGGTTGMPKQRIGWDDYKIDYEEFSSRYGDDVFPFGGDWLMIGPTGPRRLRLAVEYLANHRGGSCYFVDLDPRWVRKLIAQKQVDMARQYQDHVIEQAVAILRHRPIRCLFATPRLLEALSEEISIPDAGIRGVFCGGTSMTPQNVRFLCEEVLEDKTVFVPTYGNTLMGLACSNPDFAANKYSITYYAPQPRAVLRVTDSKDSSKIAAYDQFGRIELTTLTKEFFMPRLLERDEAIRRQPCPPFFWDGVGDVRPFGATEKKIIEGVY